MDDPSDFEREDAMAAFLEEELRRIAEEPVFSFLAANGDAIEARVKRCLEQADSLVKAGYYGAALVRAAAGIEVTVRFFLARPLVQGAFLSDDWSELLAEKLFTGRTAEDRKLLPAILLNWKIDIATVRLASGSPVWEAIIKIVWRARNNYVHKADDVSEQDAAISIECLNTLLSKVVDPLAERLGFTRERTGCWSIVAVKNPAQFPNLNPPQKYARYDPFD
jgi:hypothetical protein